MGTGTNAPICMECDGCGWCEGSPPWVCKKCGGTGLEPNLERDSRCSDCPRRIKHHIPETECAACNYLNKHGKSGWAPTPHYFDHTTDIKDQS